MTSSRTDTEGIIFGGRVFVHVSNLSPTINSQTGCFQNGEPQNNTFVETITLQQHQTSTKSPPEAKYGQDQV